MEGWRRDLKVAAALPVALLMMVCGGALAQQPQTGHSVGQDLKYAARATKAAVKETSLKVEKAMKKGVHKAAEKVRDGTEKIVKKTKSD